MNDSTLAGTNRRKEYSSDMTDYQWECVKEYVTRRNKVGAPTTTNLREVLNAILYLVRNGCAWGDLRECTGEASSQQSSAAQQTAAPARV